MSWLSEDEQAALPAYERLNASILTRDVTQFLIPGADGFGAMLEQLGFSQEYREDRVNSQAMSELSPDQRKEFEDLQFAIKQLPAGTVSLEKRRELVRHAFLLDVDKSEKYKEVKKSFLTADIKQHDLRQLLANSLDYT